MESIAKIVDRFQPLAIAGTLSILDIWMESWLRLSYSTENQLNGYFPLPLWTVTLKRQVEVVSFNELSKSAYHCKIIINKKLFFIFSGLITINTTG